MARINFTEAKIRKAAAEAPPEKAVELFDAQVPGLGVHFNPRKRTAQGDGLRGQYIYVALYPGGKHPSRRTLGKINGLSLDEAREKARAWRRLIDAGKDPAVEVEREAAEEAKRKKFTFGAVAEDYIREKLPGERKAKEVARDIRRDLVSELGGRPITDIRRLDIRNIIKRKKRTAPGQARNLLGYAKQVFKWAVNQETYGLEHSPCADIEAREIIGEKTDRERTLTDDEIFAFWRATLREPYPYRQVHQLLLLNGLRLNEGADTARTEFDFKKRDWVIPAVRMKGRAKKAKPHLVPLTAKTLEIIGTLPEMSKGPYLFSFNFGKSPVWMNSDIKAQLDKRMLRTLKAIARKRGQDARDVVLEPWVNHDLRRTCRTTLSGLKNERGQRIAEEVAEAVIAHARPGIKGTYDKYRYADEKFEALELWAQYVEAIVEPKKPDEIDRKVIPYPARQHG